MFSWKREKEREPDAVPARRSKEERLKERFREAVNPCPLLRTLALPAQNLEDAPAGTIEKKVWLEAYRDPEEGWQVQRKAQYKIKGFEQPLVQQEEIVLDPPPDFYGVVEHMAKFEAAERAPAGDEAAALGDSYYRAFAEREGIAFDFEGLPHPTTEDGLIVGKGLFPADAAEKAMQAALNRPKTALAPAAPSADFSLAALPLSALPKIGATAGSGKTVGEHAALNEMYAALCGLRDFTYKAVRNGWFSQAKEHSPDKAANLVSYAQWLLSDRPGTPALMQQDYERALEKLFEKNESLSGELKENLRNAGNLAALYAYLNYAADALDRKNNGRNYRTGFEYKEQYWSEFFSKYKYRNNDYTYTYTDADFDRAKLRIAACLEKLGYKDVSAHAAIVDRLIRSKDGSEIKSFVSEIDAAIKWFDEIRPDLEALLEGRTPPSAQPRQKSGGVKALLGMG